MFAEVVDGDEVGVAEARGGLGLDAEAVEGLGAGLGPGQQALERHQAVETELAGLVHDALPPPAISSRIS